MTVPNIVFRDEYVAPYLAEAFAAAGDGTASSPQREQELLKQVIALAELQLYLVLTYPVPPDNAPIRAAVAKIVAEMVRAYYPGAYGDPIIAAIRANNVWVRLLSYATERLVALSR